MAIWPRVVRHWIGGFTKEVGWKSGWVNNERQDAIMAVSRAYTQYNNSKILTASPAELTLMLYEGAIKFCNVAIVAVEHKDIEKANVNIQKLGNIIDYLRQTLDMKYQVAEDFERVYSYLSQRVLEANVKKDKEILEEVNDHLRAMHSTWKEVMKRSKE